LSGAISHTAAREARSETQQALTLGMDAAALADLAISIAHNSKATGRDSKKIQPEFGANSREAH
jgi:hypothetical protein